MAAATTSSTTSATPCRTLPVFATVGFREKPIRPIPINDLTDILVAAVEPRETVAVVGAEQLLPSKAVRRVASVPGRRVVVVPWPVWAQYVLAQVTEWTIKVPLVAKAQVRWLAEGEVESESWNRTVETAWLEACLDHGFRCLSPPLSRRAPTSQRTANGAGGTLSLKRALRRRGWTRSVPP